MARMDGPAIRFLVLDVDGVLTDGGLWFSAEGETLKRFDVHDGAAIRRFQKAGGVVGIISGRAHPALTRRAAELGIEHVRQGVEAGSKLGSYESMLASWSVDETRVCVIGDDLPDLALMERCAVAVAVNNALPAVKRRADYITRRKGGEGAVAEVVDLLLSCGPSAQPRTPSKESR